MINPIRHFISKDKYSKNSIRKVRCSVCSKLYPSKVEDDYTDTCADCSELTLQEQIKKRGY